MELDQILQPVAEELHLVKKELKSQLIAIGKEQSSLFSQNEYVNQRIKHLFNSTGKLLRPALVLLSAKAAHGSAKFAHGSAKFAHDSAKFAHGSTEADQESLIKLATVVEFIHSSSLVHDDIIDESEYRRKQLSVNQQFGNHTAVLVGDIINSQFMAILANLEKVSYKKRIAILNTFSNTIKKMCFGEIYEQKIRKHKIQPSMEQYLEIIKNKTASLMSASCLCGAYISGADNHICRVLENYGLYLGFAFQIADDCIDDDSIFGSKSQLLDKGEEFTKMAENEINMSGLNHIKEHLINLIHYVITTAKNKCHGVAQS